MKIYVTGLTRMYVALDGGSDSIIVTPGTTCLKRGARRAEGPLAVAAAKSCYLHANDATTRRLTWAGVEYLAGNSWR